jgi:hypothetical protein
MNLVFTQYTFKYRHLFYLGACLFVLLFLGNALVLSNYGAILEFLAIPNSQPLLGEAKLLPGLDLEAYLYTPEFQILVNNGFERFNRTSLFNEDLRSLYSLPILDWGLIFKPNLWGFFVLPAAYAFSLFHLIAIILFIVGYYRLGLLLGAKPFYASAFSIGLFFTGFVQVWWILFGTLLAVFPWVILIVTSQISQKYKWIIIYYVLTCWLFTNFYPPLIISLAFAGALFYVALEPKFYKKPDTYIMGIAAIAAAATAIFYLWEPISAIKASVYPGDRVASGGSDFPALLWLSQIFPTLLYADLKSLSSVEMAEAAAVSSYFLLIMIFFKDYSNWFSDTNAPARRVCIILLAGLILMWAWMLLPLPSSLGSIFLWDHVQPRRMVVATGILMFALSCYLVNRVSWKFSPLRCVAFSLFILLPWISYKYPTSIYLEKKLIDLLPVIACLFLLLTTKVIKTEFKFKALIFISLASNIFIFGKINPLQSAKPIFQPEASQAVEAIQKIAHESPDGIVALERFEGAVLNGLGFKSAGHALLTPQPQVYKRFFKSLPDDEFNNVFNRTASIRVFYGITPNSGGLGVNVPIENFGANLEIRKVIQLDKLDLAPKYQDVGGEASILKTDANTLVLHGWARWSGIDKNQTLYVYSPINLENITMKYTVNGRGGEHLLSSFYLSFDKPSGWAALEDIPICLFSDDPKFGVYLLENRQNKYDCVKALADHLKNEN